MSSPKKSFTTSRSQVSLRRACVCLPALGLAVGACDREAVPSSGPLDITSIEVAGPPEGWEMSSRVMNRQSASSATLGPGRGTGSTASFEQISASMYYAPASDLPITATVTLRTDRLSSEDEALQGDLQAWLEPARHPAMIFQTTASHQRGSLMEAEGNLLLRDRRYPATSVWEVTTPVSVDESGRRAGELRVTVHASVPEAPFPEGKLELVLDLPVSGFTDAFVEGVLSDRGIDVADVVGADPEYPEDASALSDVAWYLMLAGHHARALEVFQMSIDRSPEVNTYMRMADGHIFAGNYGMAVGTYRALEQYNLGHAHSLELIKVLSGQPLRADELAAIHAAWGGVSAAVGASLGPTTVPFEDPLNLIVLEASIDGKGPFRFFLDSGATSTVLDTETAKAIGLDLAPAVTGPATVASEVTIAPVRGGVEFGLAPALTVSVDQVITAPFGPVAEVMMGESFHGILGSALFERFVIEVDYVNRQVTFHDPAQYRYGGDGTVLELGFDRRMPKLPYVLTSFLNGASRLEDRPVLIDSGGQTMAMASVPNQSEWETLVTPESPVITTLGATGLGNSAEGTSHSFSTTRIDRFALGPYEFDMAVIGYSEAGPPLGSLGAAILHRFTTIYDYSRRQLILEPNGRFDAPSPVDRSGITLIASTQPPFVFEVAHVADETPGYEAGVRRGDLVLAIDGVSSEAMRLNEARSLFSTSAIYQLTLERDGEAIESTLTTRSLYGERTP